jgi:hypothetical protein
MFAPQLASHFTPGNLDRPRNGITMTADLRALLGELRFCLEPVEGVNHTYIAKAPSPFDADDIPPPTQRICFAECPGDVERPSPGLLAIHRAMALVAHASGAAEYIDRVLRERDDGVIRADGTTHLGTLIAIGLNTERGLVPVN